MIRKVFIADCDYCHEHFVSFDNAPHLRMVSSAEGMRVALKSTGWYCGEGIAPQVLCPSCRHLKEDCRGV